MGQVRRSGTGFAALVVALALALALAACAPAPVAAPPHVPAPAPAASAESAELASYYGAVQAELLGQGLMRTDMGGPDTPFTDQMLTTNFLRIAFYEEYDRDLGGTVRHEAPIALTRWVLPVRVALRFGASVPADVRATDTLRISSYLARLQRLTGHPVGLADSDTDFTVFVDNIDERRALGPVLKTLLPELTPSQIGSMTDMDRNTYCQVITQSDPATSTYSGAVAVIPSEHPDLMFMACVHEELAQALGLPNDSGLARPSIFNDDQEFALLTRQDEMMLKMLYDPALHPGMTETEARPIVEMLSSRLVGGNS
jgi:hypothetical protein